MPRIFVSSVISAPSEKVWDQVRDFNGLPKLGADGFRKSYSGWASA